MAGTNSLISFNLARSGGGNGNSSYPAISHDGTHIVFVSDASDLVANDTNGQADIFLYHSSTNTLRLVTVGPDSQAAIGPGSLNSTLFLSSAPSLSRDGRYVAFRSRATNLVSIPDTNLADDIYVRDLESGNTRLVSINSTANAAAAGRSEQPVISLDGSKVVFVSRAPDIDLSATDQLSSIYVHHLASGLIERVSGGLPFTNSVDCAKPVLSADGNILVFTAAASDDSNFWLCRRSLDTGTLSVLATNSTDFGITSVNTNGHAIAFAGELTPGVDQPRGVFLWRSTNGAAGLVSSSNGVALGSASLPAINADGTAVAFVSEVINGTNGIFNHLYLWDSLLQSNHLVSAALDGSPSRGNANPYAPIFHPTSGRIAFSSPADDLVHGDFNQATDLFWRDLASEQTELLTERAAGRRQITAAAGSSVDKNCLSADGRYLLFRTFATNAAAPFASVTNLGGGSDDWYVLRRQTARVVVRDRLKQQNFFFPPAIYASDAVLSLDGQTVAYTADYQVFVRPALGGQSSISVGVQSFGNGLPSLLNSLSLSRDGKLVAFESFYSGSVQNLSGRNIYLRDLLAGTTNAVSIRRNNSIDGSSVFPAFSSDARWVTFQSTSTDLTLDAVSGTEHLFARDLMHSNTVLLSKYQGVPLTGNSTGAVISANSRQVAFANGSDRIFVYDFATASNRLACVGCREPSLDSTGARVAFESFATGGVKQISLRNLNHETVELVSMNHLGTGPGNGPSRNPLVSGDGRFVVFLSAATDLAPNDDNNQTDLFLRDTVAQTTFLLTPGREPYPSGADLFKRPFASLDGQTIAFQSFATRLSPGDDNDTSDIFVVELNSPTDADRDGMSDAWEFVYFNSLERDGNGDFDHDGTNDRAEFNAWSNPADNSGVLSVTALLHRPDGSVVLHWPTIEGRTYRVESRSGTENGGWSEASGDLVAPAATLSFTNTRAAPQQFYRVVLQP